MSVEEVDTSLASLDQPGRSSLQTLRDTILEVVSDGEQVISHRVPAFRVQGKVVAGFAAFKDHLSYLPLSGSALNQLADQLTAGYTMTKSALHFAIDQPLPKSLVGKPDRSATRGDRRTVELDGASFPRQVAATRPGRRRHAR